MTRKTATRSEHHHAPAAIGYLGTAKRPLHALGFLLPLIVVYELCLALFLPMDVTAHKRLLEAFDAMGVPPTGGLFIGGLLIIAVLLTWHVLLRHQWKVDVGVVALMWVESAAAALPLLALSVFVMGAGTGAFTFASIATPPIPPEGFGELSLGSQLAISLGAGLYEELVFRMVFIAIIHALIVDVGGLKSSAGTTVAVLVSAALFTWYHDLNVVPGDPESGLSTRRMLFFFLAGVYFGVVYALRGFGIVVGAHALYDVVTVYLLNQDGD